MEALLETQETTQLRERLRYLAWRWYRIQPQEAEDIVQAALLTFLEVRDRYPRQDEHPRIIVGVFRNKCREHIDHMVRSERHLRRLEEALLAGTVRTPTASTDAASPGGVIGDLERHEAYCLILEAMAELRPPAREMFDLIVHQGMDRQDLIRHYGLNKNTLDSRLHTYRKELQKLLSQRGVSA